MSKRSELKIKQVITFTEFLKGFLSISFRIPYLIKLFKEISSLNEESHESWGMLLERNAEKYPNNPALKWDDSSMTYKELNEWANRYAHYFISKGLKKGDVVTVFLENRPELFMIYCAIAKTGAIASMINTYKREQSLLHSLNHAPGKIYIIGEEIIEAFQNVKAKVKTAKENNLYFVSDKGELVAPKGFIDIKREIREMPCSNPSTLKDIQLKDPLGYVFTSGTTGGLPNAAIINHIRPFRSTIRYGKFLQRTKPTDTIYCPLPFFHTNGLTVGWPTAMANGAALAIRRKFSATHFWEDVRKFNATCFIYVGELPRYLLSQPEKLDERRHSLKKIIGNGLRPEVWKEFKQRFGIKKVYEFYGAAESSWSFGNLLNFYNTVGLSLQTHAFVLCDIDEGVPMRGSDGFMQIVDVGETGLLIFKITERYKFVGYTDKKATEKKILRDVFERGDTWFNSGDLLRNMGYWHAQFVDRLGDTFRWKGENVSATEVEDVANSFPGIDLATVYGVKIPDTEGYAGMAAIVANQKVSDIDFKSLAAHFKKTLPSYAVPSFLRFSEELDSTATEKVKKKDLIGEGFDLDKVNDMLYVLLPGKSEYELLTRDIYTEILRGKYRF